MSDTAKRLAGPTALGTASATLYTVPAATTTILRHIRITNTTATEKKATMGIGADAIGTRLFSETPIPGNGGLDWSGFTVLVAAETLRGHGDAAGLTATISGVEVT